MKVHEILFIIWGVVFAMWLYRQFVRHNQERENRETRED